MNRFAAFSAALLAVSIFAATSSACAQWDQGAEREASRYRQAADLGSSGYRQTVDAGSFANQAGAEAGGFGFQPAAPSVFVNGRPLSTSILQRMAMRGVNVPPGRYWYDRRSGAWGLQGGPARGLLPAGLPLGGRLRADASNGRSGVTINGRRLKMSEAAVLRQLLPRLTPGNYWVDGSGNAGRVGGPALVNLRSLLRRRSGGRDWRYRSGDTHMIGGKGVFGINFKVAGKSYSYIR